MTKREKEKLYDECRNIVRSDDKIDALESQIVDEETCSVYMNSYEHHANYITTHWNDEK